MLPVSISIIAKNEEVHLLRLLPLIRAFAKQIVVVVDRQSSDRTEALFREHGADVYVEEFKGLVAQKQSAMEKCTQDWIVSLDCDEVPDDAMLQSLRELIQAGIPAAAIVRRRTHYLGRALRYAWQPDVHLRVVHRALHPRVISENGHDRIVCDATEPITLNGWMDHYSYRDILHHMEKTLFYARIGAADYVARNRSFSMINLLVNPWIAFVKLYIIRRAFLDGVPGLIAGVSTWLHVFLKYALLWDARRRKSQNS